MLTAEEIIRILNLKPLNPEGGFYRETYRSDEAIPSNLLPSGYNGDRNLTTSIYYLITPDSPSHLHRLLSDEIYHFYLGNPVTLLLLKPDSGSERVILGCEIDKGQSPQIVVERGIWQGLCLQDDEEFALLGTTLSPGFNRNDFEVGKKDELINAYPEERKLIKKLTKS